jgi:UDP-N-acetylglucosamine--N-acetylmuramyl-(pentapeptide) pyrophosphoryl-undecaprenol N-acetylglucosamine transferase
MPGVSAARALMALRPGSEALFVGTGRPAEVEILDSGGWRRKVIPASGLKGRGLAGWPKAGWLALRGLAGSIDLIRAWRPDAVLGTGGYVTGPVGLAAWFAGVPLVVHEQNSRPGLTNRWLGRLAGSALLGFPGAAPFFSSRKIRVTGNPVRPDIAAVGAVVRDFRAKPPRLLILGGSQGSSRLNRAALALASRLRDEGLTPSIVHQTGVAELEEVRRSYAAMGIEARAEAFFTDMAEVYREAHLVLARAGALTVAELAAARLPAILTPLPTAADDHQTLNARFLADAGAARIVPESELDERLAETASELFGDPDLLTAMSEASPVSAASAGDDATRPTDPSVLPTDRAGELMAQAVLDLIEARGR